MNHTSHEHDTIDGFCSWWSGEHYYRIVKWCYNPLYKKHTLTEPVMPKMKLEPLNVCLTDRRLNQLS